MQILVFLLVILTFFLFYNNTPYNTKESPIEENNSNISNTYLSPLDSPYIPPKREIPQPNNSVLEINERTRGEENYQLVGILYNDGINKNYQLFGRRTYIGSNEWEYYILGKDEGGLEVKFPLNNKNEIYDNTQINIPLYNSNFTVKIYEYNLKYNPNIL
jgi:hypothetical protein